MEYISTELKQVLSCVTQPAFFVCDSVIRYANPGAQKFPILIDRPVAAVLGEEAAQYAAFDGSSALSLPITAGGRSCQALVQRIDGGDLFLLTPDTDDDVPVRLDAFSNAAHTLRHPVSTLIATGNNLFPYLEEFEDPLINQHVSILNKLSYQLLRTVGNLTDAASLQSGSLAMRFERIELLGYLREMAERIKAHCAAAGVSFSFDCPAGNFFGTIDAKRLERAVLNLISNSLKYTPKGGTIRMRFERGGTHSRLIISDNGEGMDAAKLSAAFHKFAEPVGFDPRDGVGLGLPIARWIAGLHGGTLMLDSRPDGGTTAILSFSTAEDRPALRTPAVSYGGFDTMLLELSDALSSEIYSSENVN